MIIDHLTSNDVLFPKSHPCNTVPRDFKIQPADFFAKPQEIKILDIVDKWDWSGIDAYLDEKKAKKARLRDFMFTNGWQGLDQNGQGFCWSYDTAHAIMTRRLLAGLPYVRLSGHAVACKIKNYRDEGGWAALSHAYAKSNGYPDVQHWKEKSMSPSYDTADTWANAAQYKITDDVVDLNAQVYDQTMADKIWWTLLLTGNPVQMDWQFWSHSVLAWDIVRIEKGVYGIDGPNSWGMGWGDNGNYTINLSAHPRPMGAVATIGTPG